MTREHIRQDNPNLLVELRERNRDASRLFTATDPQSVAWRQNQADVDADIEGLARGKGATALMAEMDREGVPLEVQIERLKAHFLERDQDRQTTP